MAPKKRQRNPSSGPSAIGDILKEFFATQMPIGMGDEVKVFGVWTKAVGAEIARQAIPKSFRGGFLFVETRHPIWATELQTKSHLLKKKLNEALGKDLVKEIHFRQARVSNS